MPRPGNKIPHCWFVIAEKPDGQCLIVNMTTLSHLCDKTVILHKDEHPEVDHDSIILYSDAQITTFDTLDILVSRGAASRKQPCSAELLKKIQDGVIKSSETKIRILNFCNIHYPQKVNPAPRPPLS
jgi:hypothetical protein